MNKEERQKKIESLSLQALESRIKLGRYLVRQMRKWYPENPDKWGQSIDHYQGQIDELVQIFKKKRIALRKQEETEKPPTQVIQLKPAILGAKAKKR
ncbi:MAG: hypothetical protein GWN00_29470 [Aliifodinibius sp.]|nr:hypothetical protein [Fodinibius sp.]NIV14909.1 hypothetical protein [Fodinibius sp.]NIY28768.1 hypothetical protein [Fodinibius sp.]